ncbi:glutamate ligase domain-containing protein [Candidatus Berkiella aquae]|uniref:Dihydrofolate synthase/folylpolyglutamate synthase n=1 Tax=Candidatus Berkiella aquae TaxID=295108 RepID=A0A0Q9YUA5_9GAMM|nr:folylpolyglutamate synthase/dihydrofolate synthase family protein [Candidatus Berkiella aquae]MCS5711738.1 bifunctional folylpolyglutamate synthase/dihydrofolate synthase [Candidatus Berkiella aquae]
MIAEGSDLANWLAYIEHSRPQHVIDLGLDRVLAIGTQAKILHFTCPVITVAGTNGKGSTVAVLATLLQAAGLKVGTYSSPHLLHFNERIQLNGQCVSDSTLCDAFQKIEEYAKGQGLTFFEYTTLAAFAVFQAASPKLDVIILEVGLGGRLDAVNVIAPSMAIITSISLDHEQLLGTTRSAIAREKAGILRKEIPVILSKEAKIDTLLAAIEQHQNPAWIEGEDFDFIDDNNETWQFDNKTINIPSFNLPENSVSLAFAAYTVFSKNMIRLPELKEQLNSIKDMTMLGRFQTLKHKGVSIIFDVAHNAASSARLAQKLHQQLGHKKALAVWASLEDKDLMQIISPMLERVSDWFVGGLDNNRAAKPSILAGLLKANSVTNATVCNTLLDAFQAAMSRAIPGDHIIVFGSFYTVSSVLGILLKDDMTLQNGLLTSDLTESVC